MYQPTYLNNCICLVLLIKYVPDKCPEGTYRSSDMDTCSKCATQATEPNIEQSTCGML